MKTKLFKYFLTGAMVLGCTSLASASYVFDYVGGGSFNPGPSSFTEGSESTPGVTATATAVWANTTSNKLASTWLGEYSGDGLGVCNPNEQSSCSPPQHQVDNYNGFDFVLFGFSTPVSLSSVQLASFGNPTGSGAEYIDFSYTILTSSEYSSYESGNLTPAGLTFTNVNTGTATSGTFGLTGNVTSGEYLLIGASVASNYGNSADTPDAFKIQELTTNAYVTAVPEPASFFLIGSGLLAGAVFGRRRMKAKKSND